MALFKEAQEHWPSTYGDRILPDASGSFYTVVTETTMERLAEWERRIAEAFSLPEFSEWFARLMPLVESGRREFYNVEA